MSLLKTLAVLMKETLFLSKNIVHTIFVNNFNNGNRGSVKRAWGSILRESERIFFL
jgi:hypothetical protein